MKTKVVIGDLVKQEGELTSGNREKAEVLNDYFSSVFTEENLENMPSLEPRPYDTPLTTLEITPDKVKKKLLKLKKTKSAGPDGFHPRVLRECVDTISSPLAMIFNKSLQEAKLPPQWKEGHVTPIHKKGSRKLPGNYRPVSLTSVIGKVMESLVRDEIVHHMMKNNLFCDEQHGFVPGRSCMTQLIGCIEDWTEALEDGHCLDVIYLDFKKAFDSVPHQRLLSKLEAYGITGTLQKWLVDFLIGRKQRVVLGGETSEWTTVKSGIPQGSVLGPVLFVIFINDLPDALNSTVKIFADDTKIYRPLRGPSDITRLQDDINAADKWSKDWQLHFNATKIHALHFGWKNEKHQYHIGEELLEPTNEEKDLGVTIDQELKFHRHVALATKRANGVLSQIRRTIKYKEKEIIIPLYMALVRPLLEYGNVIWNPRYKEDQKDVEKVQRRATKIVRSISHLEYGDRLRQLNLPSLQHRRRRGDMIQVYKIISGIDRVDPDRIFEFRKNSTTRGHEKKLFKHMSRLNVRKEAFSQRTVNDWNSLPQTVIEAETLDQFKSRLDRHWLGERYKHPFEGTS